MSAVLILSFYSWERKAPSSPFAFHTWLTCCFKNRMAGRKNLKTEDFGGLKKILVNCWLRNSTEPWKGNCSGTQGEQIKEVFLSIYWGLWIFSSLVQRTWCPWFPNSECVHLISNKVHLYSNEYRFKRIWKSVNSVFFICILDYNFLCMLQVSKLKEQLETTVQKLNESREVLQTNENGEDIFDINYDIVIHRRHFIYKQFLEIFFFLTDIL